MADWDTASRCPDCNLPGKQVAEQIINNFDGKLITLSCGSKFCALANGESSVVWIVQVRSDGTIPDPQNHAMAPKEYVGFDDHIKQASAYAAMILKQSLSD